MFGNSASARTIAYPSRWVNETLPPRERRRWLLMTMRLSARSLAGTARTLVAVGSSSEACMFLAIALAAPRSGFTVTSSASSPCDFAGLVDPAAGLLSPFASAPEERAAVDQEVDGGGAPVGVDPDDDAWSR